MTRIIDTKSKRRRPAKLAAGFALAAVLALGAFAGSARAEDRDGGHRGWERHGYNHGWNGGYYRAPPLVYGSPYYGSPYYYPPPVVYGRGIGISLPGVDIGIR